MSNSNQVDKPRAGASAAKRRVFIKTFGCQMNEYDTQKLFKILEPDYERSESPSEADLVVVNTCSVRDKPEQKLYSMLGEMQDYKRKNPGLMVGVGGCVAQQEGANIIKRSKVVDFVFGTHNLSLVPSLIKNRAEGGEPQAAVDYREEWEDLPLGLAHGSRVSSFVSISRGCNKNCTYCIVPTTRGKEVSRAEDEILKEVRLAAHRGVKEIILLGQTVNSYGRDFNPRRSFVGLLRSVAQVEGIERIRFTSPHPQEVREDFFELLSENPKICRHIHMPLQSGSSTILRAMNRNYKRERYLEIIEGLRSRHPDIGITTDIIVGFPGETEADFEQTLEVMDIVGFDNSYSFIYSPRPGTPAALMEDTLSDEEKLSRLQRLQARQEAITRTRLREWVGREVEVLIEGPSHLDPSRVQGRTSQNIMTSFTDSDDSLEPGMIVRGLVEGAGRFSLKARSLKSASISGGAAAASD